MSPDAGQCPSCGRTFPRGGGHCPFDGTRIVALAPAPSHHLVGRILEERYEVREPIGAGRIGTTYRGYQMSVARDVLITVIHPVYARDPEAGDRFLLAGQRAAQLVAPAIGNVYDVGHAGDDVLYVVSELVRGRPLADFIKQRLALRRGVGIALQICDALDAAHRAHMVHGDLEPANVYVDDTTGRDTVKVVDFGLARALDPVLSKPDPHRAPLHYTAPDLFEGAPTPASDQYALGCILFELLVGTPPFTAASPDALAARHRREPPPALPPNVPVALAAIVQQLLAKSPRDRFRTCGDLRARLEPVLASVGGPSTDLPRAHSITGPHMPRTRTGERGDPTTPPTGPSAAYPALPRTRTGERGDPTTPPTGPSAPYVRDPTTPPSTPPTGPSGPYARDPTTPPTGPSGHYVRDPTTPPTGPSGMYGFAPQPSPPVTPASSGRGRRLLVIAIVAILTTAAGIAALLVL